MFTYYASISGHMTYCAGLIPKLCGRPGNEATIVLAHMTQYAWYHAFDSALILKELDTTPVP